MAERPGGQRARRVAVALLLGAAGLLALGGPARAAISHKLTGSFDVSGTVGKPGPLAVDDATGDVYMLDLQTGNIARYNGATGLPDNFYATGTNTIPSPSGPDTTGIAVDNSGGLNQGVFYEAAFNITEYGDGQVYVYLPSGRLVTSVTRSKAAEEGQAPRYVGRFLGVTTDASGSFFIQHGASFDGYTPYVDEFSPGVWIANLNPPQDWPIVGTFYHQQEGACRIAVNSSSLYVSADGGIRQCTGISPVKMYPRGDINMSYPASQTIDASSTAIATDLSNDDLYSDEKTQVTRFDPAGVARESFGGGDFTNSAGVAVDSANGTVYVSDQTAKKVFVYSAVTTPDVSNVAAAAEPTTARLTGRVDPAGAGGITGCRFEYGTTAAYGSFANCSPSASPSNPLVNPTNVHSNLPTNLSRETTYHYRLDATNANGTTYGPDQTFTTHNVAGVETEAPTEVTQTTATLNGSFSGDGTPTSYFFEWGTSAGYGEKTAVPPGEPAGSPTGRTSVSAPISNLDVYEPTSPAYHFRLVATNANGATYGPDRTFHTAPPFPPQISGTSAAALGPTAATLSAQVNPGNGDTVYSFEYGADASYGSFTPISESIGSDSAYHPVSAEIASLTPGTIYHYRAVAINFGGVSYGPDQTFATPGAPRIDSTSATAVGQTSAHLSAQVGANSSPTSVHFEYGASNAYGQSSAPSAIGSDPFDREAGADVAGLSPSTTYHFRAVAANAIATTYGPDRTFTTVAAKEEAKPKPPPPKPCRKGFVRKHGKCVKKPHRKGDRRKHHKRSGRHG